ncbi:MAG: ankyrin repeat domain-containing protein [Flavobacteriales bacterium]
MKNSLMLVISLCLSLVSCGQGSRNVIFFKDTEAYELAKAVEKEDLQAIENLVKKDSTLLEVTNPKSGSNVLTLALYTESYEAFKKLLELGADPNFVNPFTKKSALIESIKFYKKPEPYTIDKRYAKLLLENGAAPNYTIENDFTDEKGHFQNATTPLMQASKFDVDFVKLLIKAGADPYKKLEQNQETPFSSSLKGFKNKFEIADYFIDSLKVDVKQPMSIVVQKPSDKLVEFYVQDYVVNKFLKAKLTDNTVEMENLKKENPNIEEANREGWEFIQKLESMGVDFKNYNYKK